MNADRENGGRNRLCQHSVGLVFCILFFSGMPLHAGEDFTHLLAQGDLAGAHGDVNAALKCYAAADQQAGTNCGDLCRLTKDYCDLMHGVPSTETQHKLAELALADAHRAEQADPNSATAHLCMAVCYLKNFPWAPNATKVAWSKAIKTECDAAIALNPREDIAYYMLGRWEFGVANMNFVVKGLTRVIYGGLPAASDAEAVRDFQKAIALAPNRIIHHSELARVYEAMGENKLAEAELQKCATLKPTDRDDMDAQTDAAQRLAKLEAK
jgi:tetratricopeptide (TPR) repeat protein